jgi:hypothetical protein
VAQIYPRALGSRFVASYNSQGTYSGSILTRHHTGHQSSRFRFRLFCDRRSVGQSVLLSGPNLGPMTRFLLLSNICGLHVEGREVGSVIYSYILLSLFGQSPAELMTTSFCLIWNHETESCGPSSSSNYIATDSQSAISFWCHAPFGAGDQMLHFFEWQLLSLFFM